MLYKWYIFGVLYLLIKKFSNTYDYNIKVVIIKTILLISFTIKAIGSLLLSSFFLLVLILPIVLTISEQTII